MFPSLASLFPSTYPCAYPLSCAEPVLSIHAVPPVVAVAVVVGIFGMVEG